MMSTIDSSGDCDDQAEDRRPPESLTTLLRRREQVARCASDLAIYLGTSVEEAEALLMGEARRRRVPVSLLARRVISDTAVATGWTAERCPDCGGALRVAVLERCGLARELVCPVSHPQ